MEMVHCSKKNVEGSTAARILLLHCKLEAVFAFETGVSLLLKGRVSNKPVQETRQCCIEYIDCTNAALQYLLGSSVCKQSCVRRLGNKAVDELAIVKVTPIILLELAHLVIQGKYVEEYRKAP